MKGLILKDVYAVRMIIILSLLLMVFPIALYFITDGLAMTEQSGMEFMKAMPLVLFNLVMILPFSSFVLNTLKDDIDTGWAKLQLALPVTRKQIVDSKFISSAVIVGMLTLISLSMNIAGVLIYDIPAEIPLAAPFVLASIALTSLFMAFPLSLKLGTSVASLIYTATMLLVCLAAIVVIFIALENTVSAAVIRIILYGGFPAVTVITAIISHKAAQKLICKDNAY